MRYMIIKYFCPETWCTADYNNETGRILLSQEIPADLLSKEPLHQGTQSSNGASKASNNSTQVLDIGNM